MRVRMKGTPYWTFYGQEWPKIGKCGEYPDGVARDLVQQGWAEYAGKEPVVETAAVEAPEVAAAMIGKARGRRR